MNSEKLVEKMISRLFDDASSRAAHGYRTELVQLIRAAKAEQRIYEAEQLVARPELRDAFFSIDSWR